MPTGLISHDNLMESSWQYVDVLAHQGSEDEQQIAGRVIGDPVLWRRWEAGHAQLMRNVADERRVRDQILALRQAALSLIHRKALFDYMRARHLVGAARRQLVAQFHGVADYPTAMVSEHDIWLRSSCSHFCSAHVGVNLMNDATFDEPLQLYEDHYREYFNAFCDSNLHDVKDSEGHANRALLPYLKNQLVSTRKDVLGSPRLTPQQEWDRHLRKPTGDTLKLRSITLMPEPPRDPKR